MTKQKRFTVNNLLEEKPGPGAYLEVIPEKETEEY